MDFSVYWQLFRRRLPLVIFLTMIGTGIGIWLAMTLPAIYKSEAILVVESGQIPDEMASSTVQTGEIEALQIIRQRILSREVLLELANDLNIYAAEPNMGADAKVDNMRERIEISTRGGQVTRRGPRDATIVTVGFSAQNPDLAANTVNQLVTLILQTNLEMRTAVAEQTLEFFTQEVDRFEAELSQMSSQILAFQENNLEALPDSLEFRRERLARLQERLQQLEREQATLQDRRAQLVTLFETTGSTQVDGSNRIIRPSARPQVRPAEQRLAELRGEYASLSAVLSENNPRMALLRSQIAAAEELVASLPPIEEEQTGEGETNAARSLYEIQLADLDAQIVYIQEQKESTQAQIAELRRSIEATPGNAVTLAALERSYSALQEQYRQAVANRARAETGSMIESLSRGQRITVVEQAVPSENPDSPNRPVVTIAGFASGLGLAVAIALLLELLNRSIRRPEDLHKALGVEPFATIPYIETRGETINRNLQRVVIALIVVTTVVGGLWFVDRNVRPLIPLLEQYVGSVF